MPNEKILLQMKGITKRFPGTLALDNVNLTCYAGAVHVLLGENGAGKSTLVKIISGVYTKDEGEMEFEGRKVDYKNVREAIADGISIIHQELNLLPERTIAQNIYIGHEPKNHLGIVDYKKMREDSKRLLQELGLDLDPSEYVKNLSIAQQQMVEVTKALSNKIKLLIMDEPTSSLTQTEIDKLFEIIENLKKQGVGIIYISHRMDEIKKIGDQITIMRDGKYIDTLDAKTVDMDKAVTLMVGRKIEKLYERNFNKPGDIVFETKDLKGLRFRNINITVRAGEIVSLSGLVGAGRSEIAKAVFGYEPILGGYVELFGKKITKPTPKTSIENGMSFLPEDRKAEGLHLAMPIKENIVSASLKMLFPNHLLNLKKEKQLGELYKEKLRIATPNVDKVVGELSGGNQQKVVIAKYLATSCKFIIFDEPTRGIDIGAKAEIYALMDDLASKGYGILMISSELSEVIGISDRVYIMKEGEIRGELEHDELTQARIMAYAI